MPPLIIASYNVFFEPIHFQTRFQWIVLQLLPEADLVCLQEIPIEQLEFCEEILHLGGFHFQIYASSGQYGIITASKTPWINSPHIHNYKNTIMGRNFIHLELEGGGREGRGGKNSIHLINTHLESMFQYQKVRETQMKEIIDYCQEKDILSQKLILMGDLNTVYPKIYRLDRHLTLLVDQPTWFGSRFFDNKAKSRFDRIYISKDMSSSATVSIVGDEKIPEVDCYPSDHNGLILNLKLDL